MDTDTTDATNGVGDSINGDTKHDHAKLAQQAIIKQVSVYNQKLNCTHGACFKVCQVFCVEENFNFWVYVSVPCVK